MKKWRKQILAWALHSPGKEVVCCPLPLSHGLLGPELVRRPRTREAVRVEGPHGRRGPGSQDRDATQAQGTHEDGDIKDKSINPPCMDALAYILTSTVAWGPSTSAVERSLT